MHVAVQKGNKEVVAWLLEHKANADAKNNFGKTPLLLAVQARQGVDVAELLVKHGASVNWTDENGVTLLHFAAAGNDKSLVELFLNNKLDVNVRDAGGNTPLHYAAEAAQMSVVETLIAHKANARALNKENMTPTQYAGRPREGMGGGGMVARGGGPAGGGGSAGGGTNQPASPQPPAGGVMAGKPPDVDKVLKYLKKLEAGDK